MDPYRPQSPQLSSYAPQSPDLSGRPQSPDLSGQPAQPAFGSFNPLQQQQSRFGGSFGGFHGGGGGGGGGGGINYPTSVPQPGYQQPYYDPHQQQQQQQHHHHHQIMAAVKTEDGDYYPDVPPTKRPRGRPPGSGRNQLATTSSNGRPSPSSLQQPTAPSQPSTDPTLGVELKTSFPVARIKRIMQADEDVGKVAQVTPHVVSRALELFMIKLISASAVQARGGNNINNNPPSIKSEGSNGAAGSAGAAGTGNKGPKRILAQHMKKAIQGDETLDFLADIAEKVPDAPSKQSAAAAAKKEAASNPGSESEGEAMVKPKRKGRKRKDSADD
ncbi:hypothetical protein KC335_g4988 [Hortaea werneckii]|nr:hypothetical protein KC335_g4988 [Hortaea werneckii]